MDALLGQYGLSALGSDATTRSKDVFNSINDLQQRLHDEIASKQTETRAEHVSSRVEMCPTAVLHVKDELEPDSAEGLEKLQSSALRTVTASETILNQPMDDPKLQRLVAKNLAGAIGVVDRSAWSVRQVFRSAQGWTFTYQCKHSLQAWNRQNARNPERLPIGMFSGNRGLDPINLSRPAFDCRGALTIAFSKSRRAIVVNYEHTPLHKTVAELVESILPTLPPPPVANNNTPNVNRTIKAKRPPLIEGEESSRKKRKRKLKGVEEPEAVTHPAEVQTQVPEAPLNMVSSTATPTFYIPPPEAARRKELANKLLSDKGIDPATLSQEQFTIFSNQAPYLQEQSLEMLATYGAERLRIIHPNDKEQPTSPSSTPAPQTTPAAGTNGNSGISTPASATPSEISTSWKENSDTIAADVEGGDANTPMLDAGVKMAATASAPSRKMKTRSACNTCKLTNRKCGTEYPKCLACQEYGETCVYLQPIPQNKNRKSEMPTKIIEGEDSDNAGDDDESVVPEPLVAIASIAQVVPMGPNWEHDEIISDVDILSGQVQPHGGLFTYHREPEAYKQAFPQPNASQPTTQNNGGPSDDYLPQTQLHSDVPQCTMDLGHQTAQPSETAQASPGLTFSTPMPNISLAGQVATRASKRNIRTAQNLRSPRNSTNSTTQAQQGSTWASSAYLPVLPPQNITQSLTAKRAQESAKRSNSRRSDNGSNTLDSNGTGAAAALSQTPVPVSQQPQYTSLGRSNSAPKPRSRTKSRQAQRSQIQTPIVQMPTPSPNIPVAHNTFPNISTPATSSDTSSAPTYDPLARYDSNSSDHYSQHAISQSTRVAYEPNSYVQSASGSSNTYATQSYDYSRGAATSNPLNQVLDDMPSYSNANTSNVGQWASQTRSSQDNTPANVSTNTYKVESRTQALPSHSRRTRSAQREAPTPANTYNHPQEEQQHHLQDQTYGSYSQQTDTNQQQSQNWFTFQSHLGTTGHASYETDARNTGLGPASLSEDSGYNQDQRTNVQDYAYNQELYDLL